MNNENIFPSSNLHNQLNMKVTEVILKHKITTYMHVYTDPQLGNIFFQFC